MGPYHLARLTSLTNYPDFSHSWQEKLSKYAGAFLHIYHEGEKVLRTTLLDHKDAQMIRKVQTETYKATNYFTCFGIQQSMSSLNTIQN